MDELLEFADLLDPDFQQLLLALMARDADFTGRARPIVRDGYFDAEIYRRACRGIFRHWDTYHCLPTPEQLSTNVSEECENEETREAHKAAIHALWKVSEDDLNRDWLADELVRFAELAQTIEIIKRASASISVKTSMATFEKNLNVQRLAKEFDRIAHLRTAFADLGSPVRKNWKDAIEPESRRIFLTGFEGLDEAFRGGLREGELATFLAPMKRGKSLVLVNLAAGLMAMGHNVIYYTLEMSRLDVLKRIVACISNQPTNHLDEHISSVAEAMEALQVYTNADIVVKRLPALRHSVFDLESHYQMVMTDAKEKAPEDTTIEPYVVIVDYATLLLAGLTSNFLGTDGGSKLASIQSDKTWISYPTIMVQLREMGIRFGTTIITAHQSNSEGLREQKQHEGYIAGAKQIGAHVDYMLSIDQSDADYSVNRFSITPFLSRNARKDKTTYWKATYENSAIEEISREAYNGMLPEDEEAARPRRARGGRQA